MSPSWNTISWLWGHAKGFEQANFTPNVAGAFKLQIFGAMDIWMVHAPSAFEKAKAAGFKVETNAELITFMETLTDETKKKLVSAGLEIYMCQLEKAEMIWIPQSWLVLERCNTSALIYGVRKSFFMRTDKMSEDYEIIKSAFEKGGNKVDKMEQVLKCFKK